MLSFSFYSDYVHNKKLNAEHIFIINDYLIPHKGKIKYFQQSKNIFLQGVTNKKIQENSYIVASNVIFKIKKHLNNYTSEVECPNNLESFYLFDKEINFYLYDSFGKKEEIKNYFLKQMQAEKAIYQAIRELNSCKEFNVTDYNDANVKYALCEWALFLLSGGEQQDEIKDQRLGIKKKKIDVIEFEYSDNVINFFPKFGCPEAWQYLSDYINKDYLAAQYNTIVSLT